MGQLERLDGLGECFARVLTGVFAVELGRGHGVRHLHGLVAGRCEDVIGQDQNELHAAALPNALIGVFVLRQDKGSRCPGTVGRQGYETGNETAARDVGLRFRKPEWLAIRKARVRDQVT